MNAPRVNVATLHQTAAIAAAWHAEQAEKRASASATSHAFAVLSRRLHWRAARATLLAIVAGF